MTENSKITRIRQKLHAELPRLQQEFSVRSLGVFGSYVRGEQNVESDLDILVEFDDAPGLLRFMELEQELTHITGIRVDLVQKEAVKPAIGKRIMQEVQPL